MAAISALLIQWELYSRLSCKAHCETGNSCFCCCFRVIEDWQTNPCFHHMWGHYIYFTYFSWNLDTTNLTLTLSLHLCCPVFWSTQSCQTPHCESPVLRPQKFRKTSTHNRAVKWFERPVIAHLLSMPNARQAWWIFLQHCLTLSL